MADDRGAPDLDMRSRALVHSVREKRKEERLERHAHAMMSRPPDARDGLLTSRIVDGLRGDARCRKSRLDACAICENCIA